MSNLIVCYIFLVCTLCVSACDMYTNQVLMGSQAEKITFGKEVLMPRILTKESAFKA